MIKLQNIQPRQPFIMLAKTARIGKRPARMLGRLAGKIFKHISPMPFMIGVCVVAIVSVLSAPSFWNVFHSGRLPASAFFPYVGLGMIFWTAVLVGFCVAFRGLTKFSSWFSPRYHAARVYIEHQDAGKKA